MITATIQSIAQQGGNLVAFVQFPNGLIPYIFSTSDTPTSISARIQADVDAQNSLAYQLGNVQSLVGTVFQSDATTLQGNVDAMNTAAVSSVTAIGASPNG